MAKAVPKTPRKRIANGIGNGGEAMIGREAVIGALSRGKPPYVPRHRTFTVETQKPRADHSK